MPLDHFNMIAGFYDRAGPFIPDEALLALLALAPESSLLDAGGGTGRVAAALRGLAGETFVADVSRGMLRRAARKGLATVCAPVEFLPFRPESFDRIIMVDALHHVSDQRLCVDELWRTLAPGGRLVIIEPDIHTFAVKLIAIAEKILLMRSHILDGGEIAALFADLNGAKISVTYDKFNVICVAEK